MAVGDRFILDLTWLGIGAPGTAMGSLTPIFGFLSRAEIVVTNTLVTTPPTFGQHGESNDVAESYSWQLMLDIYTDGYGGSTIDQVVTQLMRPPLGPSTATGKAQILARATAATAGEDNPSYGGVVAISEWRPLGGGAKGEAVMNNVTWRGDGTLAVVRS